MTLSRRRFLELAATLGAAAVWSRPGLGADPIPDGAPGRPPWRERRDLFPEGVASGDPDAESVLLWTRRPFSEDRPPAAPHRLTVEVALDEAFTRPVARAEVAVRPEADWTCRALVGGLAPATIYHYRFTDDEGNGSRIGRTRTAPAEDDPRPVSFAFVSCQNVNQGAQNAYRRMIHEDERAAEDDQLGFVLHLGDFVYEIVWYPDEVATVYDRRIREVVRYEHGRKIGDLHAPTTVDEYRALYRAYLADPDLQDARARFPFVPMWDNHEFSWQGWQSFQVFDGVTNPAQTIKVAANQAWWEYLPARVAKPSGPSLETFDPPAVVDAPIERFDEHGLGTEPNNLAAIGSLTGYRALRWGANVDLLITDLHSYRSEEPTGRSEAAVLQDPARWPNLFPEEAQRVLDAGRAYPGGAPPTLRFGATEIENFRRDEPPQTILGAEQKAWFLGRLRASRATWKIWGSSAGTLDWRVDPQHVPEALGTWPGAGYAGFGGGDPSAAYLERAEIYRLVRDEGITGFATVAGDRHSFWAGYSAESLPPGPFEPVGVAFVTGSISAPGLVEALEHRFPKEHPLRPLFLTDRPGGRDQPKPDPAVNLLLHHGVRACLEYAETGDAARARAAADLDLSPHLSFVDMGGHGYATVRVAPDELRTDFVCIPRPLERSETPDGGPLRYRVRHRARLWKRGECPRLERIVLEGDPGLAL